MMGIGKLTLEIIPDHLISSIKRVKVTVEINKNKEHGLWLWA